MTRLSTWLFAAALITGTVAAAPPTMTQSGAEPQQMPAEPAPPVGPMTQPSAAPTADPAMLARAKSWFAALQAGNVDRSQLSASANSNMTVATINNAQSVIGGLGTPVSFVQQQAGVQGSISYAIYLVTFKDGKKLDFLFAVDQQGKIASLGLGTPH
jgi:hypothetical protein